MFLLVLQPNYLQEVLGNPSNIPGASLLHKVMPSVFDSMRAYYLQQAATTAGAAALVQKYKDIHTELYTATSTATAAQSTVVAAGTPAYSSPDECPCIYDNSCPQVEALLKF
jgi:hypothetical protein